MFTEAFVCKARKEMLSVTPEGWATFPCLRVKNRGKIQHYSKPWANSKDKRFLCNSASCLHAIAIGMHTCACRVSIDFFGQILYYRKG